MSKEIHLVVDTTQQTGQEAVVMAFENKDEALFNCNRFQDDTFVVIPVSTYCNTNPTGQEPVITVKQ